MCTPWVKRTMLQQITYRVTTVFAGYTLLFVAQLLVTMYFFRVKLIMKADEVIEQQGVEALEHTTSNILTQIEQFQNVEEQLIERQSQFLLDILSDRHGVGIHPVDWQAQPALSLNEIKKYPEPRPRVPVFHREIYQMQGRTLDHAKQLLSVYQLLAFDRIQGWGTMVDIDVTQQYIQMVRDGFCLYSVPPAVNLPSKWSDYIDGYRIGDLSHHEMYRKARRFRTTVVNLVAKDLETESKDVITLAHPIFADRALWGVIFWEIERDSTFNQTLIPNSVYEENYPFVQILYPESPLSGEEGRIIFEKNDVDA